MQKDFQSEKKTAETNMSAKEAESNEDIATAIRLYEENIKLGYPDPFAYDRLMIIYRKLKEYKKEMRVINRAIKVFSDDYDRHRKSMLSDAKSKKKVMELSSAIMKKSGLADRKGNETYIPEPVGRWIKRKEVLQKKISKST
ncbi:MAG TPA: hypothetical protein VGD17_01135 [Chitinophagaceae bacterium]